MKIKLSSEDLKKLKKNRGVRPHRVKFQITNACNARCKHCNLYLIKPDVLPRTTVLNTLSDLAELGCKEVDFTGGEPTTHPDFIEFIQTATNYGFSVKANTNGFLLNEKLADGMVKAGLKELAISIDSHNAEEHDKRRCLPGGWQRAIDGINFIDKYRKKYSTKTKIILYSILSNKNYKHAPEIIDLKKIANFDEINFIPIKDIENKGDFLSKEQIEDYYRNIKPTLVKKFHDYGFTGIFRTVDDPFGVIASKTEDRSTLAQYTEEIYKNLPCFISNFYAYVISDGSVVQCCVAPHHLTPEFIMGNINQQSFKEIWNSDRYNNLRQILLNPRFEICKCCSGHHTAFNLDINQQIEEYEKC
jgi:MoaA/NifB/PqqE/SkfB family radical SAM enzyme